MSRLRLSHWFSSHLSVVFYTVAPALIAVIYLYFFSSSFRRNDIKNCLFIKIPRSTKSELLQGALGRTLYTLHLSHLSPTLARFLSLFALNHDNFFRFGKPNGIFPQLLFDLATGLGNSACLESVCPSPSPTPCRSPCAPYTCRWTDRHQPPFNIFFNYTIGHYLPF